MANSKRKRERIIKKYGGICQICGESTEWPELDHILPRKYGGGDEESNLSLLCASCNNKRSDRFGFRLIQKIIKDSKLILNEFDYKHLRYEYRNGTVTSEDIDALIWELTFTFNRAREKLLTLGGDEGGGETDDQQVNQCIGESEHQAPEFI